MCEENLNDVKNEEIAEKTRSANPFWPFIPAGITWFIGLFFIILECCRAVALDEVKQIRQDFEVMLRSLERKTL